MPTDNPGKASEGTTTMQYAYPAGPPAPARLRRGPTLWDRASKGLQRGLSLLLTLLLIGTVPMGGAGAVEGTQDPTFTFDGGGWGHSSGMSQYGAYGMALEGYTYDQILANYYPTLPLADADPGLLATPLWVGLTQEQATVTLAILATGTAETVPVVFTQGEATLFALKGETATVAALPDGTCQVTTPAGSTTGACTIDVAWDGSADAPTTRLAMGYYSYARGVLHIRPDNNVPSTFNVSLEIDLEDYLLGLGEMPASWGTNGGMEALKAQAVAGRSYALNRKVYRGDPASRPFCWCHLYSTTVDQAYVGWRESSPYAPWLAAVAATAGKVLGTNPAYPSVAFYSASTFGWTETNSDDHWALKPEVKNPYGRWRVTFTASTLAAKLGMTDVTSAQATGCSAVTGSITQITFTGSGGSKAFSTYSLKSLLGFRSPQVIHLGAPPVGNPPCPGPGLLPSDSWPLPVIPPPAPSGLQGTAGDGRVTWSWQAPSTDGGAAVADYLIQYRAKGAADWATFDDGVGTGLQVEITGLVNATAYEAQVAAVNSAGAGAWSAPAEATPVAPAAPPAPPPPPPPPTVPAAVTTFLNSTSILRLGSVGTAVLGLQQFLQMQGYQVGNPDGRFGYTTRSAVIAFQRAQRLYADGIVGSATRRAARALVEAATGTPTTTTTTPTAPTAPDAVATLLGSTAILRLGSVGTAVLGLQQFLQTHGYQPGTLDGRFGYSTRYAVIAFQRAQRLYADGVVGTLTRNAIRALVQ